MITYHLEIFYEVISLINDLRNMYKIVSSVGVTDTAKAIAMARVRFSIVKLVALLLSLVSFTKRAYGTRPSYELVKNFKK
ncbi:MAG: hypothetical protein COB02_15940 [Candidatus Cloacimonadota bacterium]|nr:MAG: hypothetical protein COB02_15940 [Candidatus Cloacimonadota bacterium]